MQARNTFSKKERLTHKKKIEDLYLKGHSFLMYPILVHWKCEEVQDVKDAFPRLVIGASKKKLKKAVDRNKAKRLIREAYRKNKEELIKLLEKSPFEMHISIIYTANEILSYQEIESKIIAMIIRLKNNLNNQKNA